MIFIDVNVPPTAGLDITEKPWLRDVSQILGRKLPFTNDEPDPASAVAITNYAQHYEKEARASAGEHVISVSQHVQYGLPEGFLIDLNNALSAYGNVPNFDVETKNYSAKIGVGTHTLFIGGRARPNLVNQAWREAVTVQHVLAPLVAHLGVDAQPVLCFHGGQISRPGASVQGVRIVGRDHLLRLLKKTPTVLSPTDIQRVHHMADVLLKPAQQTHVAYDPLAHHVLAPGS